MACDVYESWRPQIGDRVRVRLNGECQACLPGRGITLLGSRDGKVGTIAFAHEGHTHKHGHCYLVFYDKGDYIPITVDFLAPHTSHLSGGFSHAAVELEPA